MSTTDKIRQINQLWQEINEEATTKDIQLCMSQGLFQNYKKAVQVYSGIEKFGEPLLKYKEAGHYIYTCTVDSIAFFQLEYEELAFDSAVQVTTISTDPIYRPVTKEDNNNG